MFTYQLPEDRIAQRPLSFSGARSDARLLHARAKASGLCIQDRAFTELPEVLRVGDLLILNNTKVLPARVFAKLKRTAREVELLFVKVEESGRTEAIARPMRKVRAGDVLVLAEGLEGEVQGRSADERRLLINFTSAERLKQRLYSQGMMPIPPYIRGGRADEFDELQYQTVFASEDGSLAAPTASLHFTDEILNALRQRGVHLGFLTHHVGTASVSQIDLTAVSEHKMAAESYRIGSETRAALRAAKQGGRRVVAVGTTVVRALESEFLLGQGECPVQDSGFQDTSLFIYPGHRFQAVDALVTNFHQPSSTHLQLVAAFIGEAALKEIYQHALETESYRFLSYGDSSLLENE